MSHHQPSCNVGVQVRAINSCNTNKNKFHYYNRKQLLKATLGYVHLNLCIALLLSLLTLVAALEPSKNIRVSEHRQMIFQNIMNVLKILMACN